MNEINLKIKFDIFLDNFLNRISILVPFYLINNGRGNIANKATTRPAPRPEP
jgi:hypothetical protein